MVVDTIMNVVDTGAAVGKPKAAPKKEDDLWGDVFETEVTRTGKDLYINANTISANMLVAALACQAPRSGRHCEHVRGH